MAPVVIIGAMIGAGIGGGMAMHNDQNIFGGMLMGAAGGAALGAGAGALGVGGGLGASIMGAGEAGMSSIGAAGAMSGEAALAQAAAAPSAFGAAAAPASVGSQFAGASSLLEPTTTAASGAVEATGAVSGATKAAETGGFFSGLTGKDIVQGGLSLASTANSLLSKPDYPDQTQAPIAPSTKETDPIQSKIAEQTPGAIDEANKRQKSRQAAIAEERAREEANTVASLVAMQDAYTDPRAFLKRPRTALERQRGIAPGVGRFRFNTL